MTDIMSPEKRSRVMSRIRGKNTTPERYLAELIDASGLKFNRHDRSLAGCPDFTFPEAKLAVFVEGDFWHGCGSVCGDRNCHLSGGLKISSNRGETRRTLGIFAGKGWLVLRIWNTKWKRTLVLASAG